MNEEQLDALEDHIELVVGHALRVSMESSNELNRSRERLLGLYTQPKPAVDEPKPEPSTTATLHDWRLIHADGHFRARGEIHDDTKGRFINGTLVNTSALKSIDFERGIAVTRNSVYRLL